MRVLGLASAAVADSAVVEASEEGSGPAADLEAVVALVAALAAVVALGADMEAAPVVVSMLQPLQLLQIPSQTMPLPGRREARLFTSEM